MRLDFRWVNFDHCLKVRKGLEELGIVETCHGALHVALDLHLVEIGFGFLRVNEQDGSGEGFDCI